MLSGGRSGATSALLTLALLRSSAAGAAPGELVKAELVVIDRAMHRTIVPLSRPAACPREARCLAGTAQDAAVKLSISLGAGVRTQDLDVSAEVLRAMPVRQIAVRLRFAATGFTLLGRDYRPTSAPKVVLDRFDPKWIGLRDHARPVASLLLDDDLDSARVSIEQGQVLVELELFSSSARPFGHLPRCGHVWRDIHGRVALLDRFLHAGDKLSASGQLLRGETRPLALSPWPAGRAAAFVITDHADQSSGETLHALLAGASDADLEHPIGGLLGHGIPITKALFLRGGARHGGARPQLEDASFVALAERMRAAGNELVPHSATPLPDQRATTEQALVWFAARGAHTWIDHQPQTNCEGFCQAGWHARTGIADLLAAHDFRDVWDLSEWAGPELDERDPRHLERAAATVWPLGRLEADGPESLWMFRSTWAFIPTGQFFARYAPAKLDRLEHDRGIHIAHTYLETLHPKRTFFGQRNLMLRSPNGRVTLDPRFEALLADLHRRSERGSLWVAPLGPVADRLRALRQVRLRVSEAGQLSVTRPNGLTELTIHVGATASFAPPRALGGQGVSEGTSRAWLEACTSGKPCTTELRMTDASGAPLSMFVR